MQSTRLLERTLRLCQPCIARRAAHTSAPPRIRRTNSRSYPPRVEIRHNSSDTFRKSTVDSVYDDLTKTPPSATRTSSDPLPKTEREETIAKARVVFGSRLAGPERARDLAASSTNIAGVMVPPRPEEPDNCCMSGCVNCVWDRYRDEVEEWAAASAEARKRVEAQRQLEREDRIRTRGVDGATSAPANMPGHIANSMDDDGGGSETNWTGPLPGVSGGGDTDYFKDIPVGIREFMRTEKKLKDKKKAKKAAQAG